VTLPSRGTLVAFFREDAGSSEGNHLSIAR
jgi:hypothetical protein